MDKIEVKSEVLDNAVKLGLCDSDVEETVKECAYYSAIITHPNGNRRFGNWIFKIHRVEGIRIVSDIHLIRCLTCLDHKKITVYDVCMCEGKGCRVCRGRGEVKNEIPCQDCNQLH